MEDYSKLGKLLKIQQTGSPAPDFVKNLTFIQFVFEHGKLAVTLDCDEQTHKLKLLPIKQ